MPGRLIGESLTRLVVVAGEVSFGHSELIANGRVAEVQYVEVSDVDCAYAAENLEGGDACVEEVSEQLRPGGLLLARRVPARSTALAVVAAAAQRSVGVGRERMAGRALVPEASGELAWRDRGDLVGADRQT